MLWDPGSLASGNFLGVFLGGSQFEGEGSTYVSFQMRNHGRFRVAHHTGEQVHELVPWTGHADILPLEPTGG